MLMSNLSGWQTKVVVMPVHAQSQIWTVSFAGDAQPIPRDELILNLEDSPLPEVAREVLVRLAAPATAED